MGFCSLFCRAFDYNFAELHRTKYEAKKTEGLGEHIAGYLIWRRTLIQPCTVLLCLAWTIQCFFLFSTYSPGPRPFIKNFVGEALWTNVFCPDPTHGCKAADGLSGVFYVLLITDAILTAVAFVSCVLLVIACRSWSDYLASSRHLRRAYGALFTAPFILLLVLAPAQFIRVDDTQSALCKERLVAFLPHFELGPGAQQVADICDQPIDEWGSELNATLSEMGRLRDVSTGTCRSAQAKIAEARADFDASGLPCIEAGASALESFPAIRDCAQANTYGLCTIDRQEMMDIVQAACPVTCGICNSLGSACENHDGKFGKWGNPNGVQTCEQAVAAGLCDASNANVKTSIRNACPLGCGLCDTECEDEDEAFDLNDNPMGLSSCAQAISYGPQDRNLCNAPNANLSSFVRQVRMRIDAAAARHWCLLFGPPYRGLLSVTPADATRLTFATTPRHHAPPPCPASACCACSPDAHSMLIRSSLIVSTCIRFILLPHPPSPSSFPILLPHPPSPSSRFARRAAASAERDGI